MKNLKSHLRRLDEYLNDIDSDSAYKAFSSPVTDSDDEKIFHNRSLFNFKVKNYLVLESLLLDRKFLSA